MCSFSHPLILGVKDHMHISDPELRQNVVEANGNYSELN